MHRFMIAFAIAIAIAAAFVVAPAAGAAAPKGKCDGAACADVTFSPDGCTLTASGSKPVDLGIIPNDAWRAKHNGVPTPVKVILAAGASQKFDDRVGCLSPETDIEHMTAFTTTEAAVEAAKPKKVSAVDALFGPPPTPCTGDACQPVALKEFENCLWLQSDSEKPIAAVLNLKSGASLALDLEGADMAKAKSGNAKSDEAGQVTAAECKNVMSSWAMLEKLRAGGTDVPPSPEIDGKVPACQALLAPKPAHAAKTSYHYNVYSPLSGSEYAVFRAKVETQDACVAKADLASYSANYAQKAERP